MRIAIIGSGNVATHLNRWLKAKGLTATQASPRTLSGLDKQADICLIAVADKAIAQVAKATDALLENDKAILAHTSGTTPISVFNGCQHNFGVCYPMQTFSKERSLNYDDIPMFVEGNTEHTATLLLQLAGELTSRVYKVNSTTRAYIHLGAVYACNFLNFMLSMAAESVAPSGLNLDIYKELVAETTAKAFEAGPKPAQTGPARRQDLNTINRHLEMLKSKPEMQTMYKYLSEQIINLYK